MQIGTGLYVRGSAQAVELYKKAFGLELGYHVLNPDGSYFHSELNLDGREMLSVVESGEAVHPDRTVQVGVTLDSEEDVRRAFDLLREGGSVETPLGPMPWSPCAAVVTDKFGVWWYLTAPSHYPPSDYDPYAPWDASMYKKPE